MSHCPIKNTHRSLLFERILFVSRFFPRICSAISSQKKRAISPMHGNIHTNIFIWGRNTSQTIRKNTAYRAGWVRHRPGHRDTLPRHRQNKAYTRTIPGVPEDHTKHDERNIFKTYSERYKIHSVSFYRGFVKSITAARPYTMRGAIWDKTHQVPALCATQVKSWAGTTPEE